ncbi:protein FAM107B isoform X1 [Lucilia sericata]|uniref:protein FAM107B isoform X1 n=2 Tax=Lucilia sericata TaxID=13632 RepID=UPI0018A80634|nr:protein FAM107B isoform X1 [Lucilia sericata]
MNRSSISTDIRNRIKMFENCELRTDSGEEGLAAQNFASQSRIDTDELENGCQIKATTMMMPTPPPPPPGVQTDANGLILPKKLINPCLQSTDRKQLHRELKFNTKMGISVLNQKTELQKAYEKQREKQQQHQQDNNPQQTQHSPTFGLKSELNRVIMERAQKYERARLQSESENDDDKQYVNPEYLNARAKLRAGQRTELK